MSNSGSSAGHRRAAAPLSVRCGVLTVSDTRTPDTDSSGALIRERLESAGHRVDAYAIVPDEPAQIEPLVRAWLAREDLDAVLVNGGTGIARRDRTYDVVAGLLDKTLPGFGELFRVLSYDQVGAAAMLSRAIAGVAQGTLVCVMPGSPQAVELAMDKLIVPELAHLAWELRR